MWPGDREQHTEILRPFSNVEARMVGLKALLDAKQYWRDGNYKAILGDDYAYNDRYGATGVRLARLWLEAGQTEEVETMLNRFVDDGSRDHARDRTLFILADQYLETDGVGAGVVKQSTMITSPIIREELLQRSIIHTALTDYGEAELHGLAHMFYMHAVGLQSPRWGGDERSKRVPTYDWSKGSDRPILSQLHTGLPLSKDDLNKIYFSVVNMTKGLDRFEVMVSLSEHLLFKYQASDDEIITLIKQEINALLSQDSFGQEVMRMYSNDISASSVFSWLDLTDEVDKLKHLGLVNAKGRQSSGYIIEELVNGEEIWNIVAKERSLVDVLGSVLKQHASGGEISREALSQALKAYEIGAGDESRIKTGEIILNMIPHADLNDAQWVATAERLLSYTVAIQKLSDYDRAYLDVENGHMIGQLLQNRFTNIGNLVQTINNMDDNSRNQALLSVFRFGPEKIRMLSNINFDWSERDALKILSRLEDVPVHEISAYLQYLNNS